MNAPTSTAQTASGGASRAPEDRLAMALDLLAAKPDGVIEAVAGQAGLPTQTVRLIGGERGLRRRAQSTPIDDGPRRDG